MAARQTIPRPTRGTGLNLGGKDVGWRAKDTDGGFEEYHWQRALRAGGYITDEPVAPGPHEPHLGVVCENHLPEKSSCISCDTLPTPCDGELWETVNCGRCGNRFANYGSPDDYGGDIPVEWVWNAAGCPRNGTAGAGSDWGYEGFSTREGEHYLCARCVMAAVDAVYGGPSGFDWSEYWDW